MAFVTKGAQEQGSALWELAPWLRAQAALAEALGLVFTRTRAAL